MGYRSDVVAVFYSQKPSKTEGDGEALSKRNIATLDLFVRENFPKALSKPVTDYADGLHRDETSDPDRVVWRFQNTNVKWYEGYPEVIAFEEFWERFVELAESSGEGADPIFWACEFIRLGENDDDVEQRTSGGCSWLLRVQRNIEVDY